MFTAGDRERLQSAFVETARADARIDGAALFGSLALARADAVSDIDLGLEVAAGSELDAVIADWTTLAYAHGAIDHLDVEAQALYRVFLMESTLQVDLSFWAPGELRALGPAFRALFGAVGSQAPPTGRDPGELIGRAWLYLLHVRSSIVRQRPWQATYMLDAARGEVLALACVRHELPSYEARGVDGLPEEFLIRAAGTLAGSLERPALERTLGHLATLLLEETVQVDAARAERLRPTLLTLVASARG